MTYRVICVWLMMLWMASPRFGRAWLASQSKPYTRPCMLSWSSAGCPEKSWSSTCLFSTPQTSLSTTVSNSENHTSAPPENKNEKLTAAVMQISYDGRCFSGWSASNDPNTLNSTSKPTQVKDPSRSSRRRRRRGIYALDSGSHRSVQGVIASCMAKLYGNVDPQNVVVEGVSRTDKGVHAMGMVGLVYCLSEDHQGLYPDRLGIPGKRLPHPRDSFDDHCFRTVNNMKIERLGYTLNRMLPPDIRILQVAEMPTSTDDPSSIPFHPTLASESKTYHYQLSAGPRIDPTTRRFQWHVGHQMDIEKLRAVAKILQGQHNFAAFRGAARGASDKDKFAKQDTTCRISRIEIDAQDGTCWRNNTNVRVSISGDRFLYKMMRFLVGSMVAVASDSSSLELCDVQEMLDTGVRSKEFQCAPAEGLTLVNVQFNTPLAWKVVNS